MSKHEMDRAVPIASPAGTSMLNQAAEPQNYWHRPTERPIHL
jgi:hypothetical protein